MQWSRETLLIMQIWHRLLAARTHRLQRQHLFLSLSCTHFMRCRGCSSPHPPLCSFILSLSAAELLMASMCSLNQPAPFKMWAQNVDKNPVNASLSRNSRFSSEIWSALSALNTVINSTVSQSELHPPPLQRKVTAWLYCPSGKDTTGYKHTLTSGCNNRGHVFFTYTCTCMYVHRYAINRYVCTCHSLVHFMKIITSGVSVFVSSWGSD